MDRSAMDDEFHGRDEPEGETLRGSISRVIYEAEDSDYAVIQLLPRQRDNGAITAVGPMIEPHVGQEVELTGRWTHHSKYGRQFEIDYARVIPPSTKDGMREYLSNFVTGIGPALAKRIVDKFGKKTFDVIEQNPESLKQVTGIGSAKLKTVKKSWHKHQHARKIMAFLSEHGVSPAYATRIYDRYGEEAIPVLQQDPYRLARDVHGMGFKITDRIARNMGISETDPGRWEAGLLYTLEQAENEGHCYLPREELLERGQQELEGPREKVQKAMDRLCQNGDLVMDEGPEEPDNPAVYRQLVFFTEQKVARTLHALTSTVPRWTHSEVELDAMDVSFPVEYNPRQRQAIERALSGDVLILTGGPGTGKTTTVQGMIQALETYGRSFSLAAPTGRAAKRLSESTGRSASTIHRLLEYAPDRGFGRNENDPLESDVVIVDETSMVDIHLMNSLLNALRDPTGLVMVGDSDQLPSVGCGNVLSDCLASNCLSSVRLTEIYRQARRSGIVMNAHRLNQGKGLEWKGYPDFVFVEQDDPERVHRDVVRFVSQELPGRTGMDPLKDIQVISPMKDGPAGVHQLNRDLQQELNPDRKQDSSRSFHAGDRVMQTTNNYEHQVFNGDIGFVETYDEGEDVLKVSYPDMDRMVEYGPSMRRQQLQLAYAITVHKSQGSEYPMVVMPVLKRHYVMLTRPLLYTAMTRAEQALVMVGQKQAIHIAKSRTETDRRWSGLEYRLRKQFNTDQKPPD